MTTTKQQKKLNLEIIEKAVNDLDGDNKLKSIALMQLFFLVYAKKVEDEE